MGKSKFTARKAIENHIAIILDSSGSMDSVKQEAINNFNEQVQKIKEQSGKKKIQSFVTLVTFNQTIKELYFDKDTRQLVELHDEDYNPDGTTALYDAIGRTVNKMNDKIKTLSDSRIDSSALVIIITDGYENSSTDYNSAQIKELIESKEATKKWTFTFMGANVDVLKEGCEKLGIKGGNVSAFAATANGMNVASARLSSGVESYYGARSVGQTQVDSFYVNDNSDDD